MEINLFSPPPKEALKENADGSKFIPINVLESFLDALNWSTRNFNHYIFKNGYADLAVSASIELVIRYEHNGKEIERSFVGCASFPLKSIEPNTHFLATVKSECIKNAASDIGNYFGRGLNDNLPLSDSVKNEEKPKVKPDSKIMKQFLEAVEKGDTATITMLSNIYDIKNN